VSRAGSAARERTAERKALGLEWRDYLLFKLYEWVRLYGVPPTSVDWNLPSADRVCGPERLAQIRDRHEGAVWPSATTVVHLFGRWNAMMEEVGIPTISVGGRRHARVDLSPDPELVERVRQLWEDDSAWQPPSDRETHRGVEVIAAELHESPGRILSIVSGLRDSGVPLAARQLVMEPVSTAERIRRRRQRVAELWQMPLSIDEIAEELGVSKSCISQDATRLRRAGVALPRKRTGRPRLGLLPDERAALVRLSERGWPPERIAHTVGLPVGRVQQVLSDHRREGELLVVRRARVRIMEQAGIPVEQIAKRLSVPEEVVRADLTAAALGSRQDSRWVS
jgi:transposase